MEQLLRTGTGCAVLALALALALYPPAPASAQPAPGAAGAAPIQSPAPAAAGDATPAANAADANSQENLTVLGRRKKFVTAPMPGADLPPPPDKPDPHLGRYKISGDQSTPDGKDAQTGAFIAPFGTAYTGASPVAGGLASHFEH